MRTLTLIVLAVVTLTLPACDAFGGGDPTIGGTYSGQATNGNFILRIPADTESDPDATFNVSGVDVSTSYTGTATYDYPDLDVEIAIIGQTAQFDCTVADSGDSMMCSFAFGSATLTRGDT